MGNKKFLIGVVAIVVLLIIGLTIFAILRDKDEDGEEIILISKYDYSLDVSLVGEKEIRSKKQVKELKKLFDELTEAKDANIAILDEVIIEFEDETRIYIELDLKEYCYVRKGEEGYIANMTTDFLDYVKKLVKDI